MSLAITEDHRELGRVVRDFAGKNELLNRARAAFTSPPAELDSAFPAMAGLGWCGLHLPAELGGSGFGLAELAIVLDELGAAVALGPLLAGVIGSAVLSAVGTDELRQSLLPGAAAGSSAVAPARVCPLVTVSRLVPSWEISLSSAAWEEAARPRTATIAATPMAMPRADRVARSLRVRSPMLARPTRSAGRSRAGAGADGRPGIVLTTIPGQAGGRRWSWCPLWCRR